MKTIINRKKYDTETAEKLATVCFECNGGAAIMWETLYRKTAGELFLFRQMIGEDSEIELYEWSVKNRFEPITESDAMDWGERYLSADEYIAIFGEPEE